MPGQAGMWMGEGSRMVAGLIYIYLCPDRVGGLGALGTLCTGAEVRGQFRLGTEVGGQFSLSNRVSLFNFDFKLNFERKRDPK